MMNLTMGEERIFNFAHAQVILAMITAPPPKRPLSRKSSRHPHRGGFRIRKGSHPESSSSDNANNPPSLPPFPRWQALQFQTRLPVPPLSLSSSANLLFPAILSLHQPNGRTADVIWRGFCTTASTHTHTRRGEERDRKGEEGMDYKVAP